MKKTNNLKPFYTIADLARLEGVTKEALYNRIRRGTFTYPLVKHKGRYVIYLSDLNPKVLVSLHMVNLKQTMANN